MYDCLKVLELKLKLWQAFFENGQKTLVPVLPNGPSPSREKTTRDEGIESHCTTRESRLSPCKTKSQYQANGTLTKSEYVRGTGGDIPHYVSPNSLGNESPILSHTIKPENAESPSSKNQQLDEHQSNECNGPSIGNGGAPSAANRSVTAIFAGHGKLKRLLGTLIQFASNISQDTGESVRTLILGLLVSLLTHPTFASTNFAKN